MDVADVADVMVWYLDLAGMEEMELSAVAVGPMHATSPGYSMQACEDACTPARCTRCTHERLHCSPWSHTVIVVLF